MKENERQAIFDLDRGLLCRAKAQAAITGHKSLKAWLIEAINEKIERETKV
jgi:hypothetical protein